MSENEQALTPVAPEHIEWIRKQVSEGDKALMGEALMKMLLQCLGEDHARGGLRETPARAWKAWQFWTSGYMQNPEEVLKTFEDGSEGYDEMVLQGSIPLWSMCEHHLAPFFGYAHIGYIPNGKVVGLSKLSRLVDIYARRLTMQERITSLVAKNLYHLLNAHGVGVVLQCRHSCMESRGICKSGTITITSALLGGMKTDDKARAEFMSFVNTASQGMKAL